jgi:GAF domain-containing protein/ligand-binding sensor protein
MTVYFPLKQMIQEESLQVCYRSCYSVMQTVSELTGLTLTLFSVDGKQCAPIETFNPFCKLIHEKESSSSINQECTKCHKKLFDEAMKTGELITRECRYRLKSFILPLKSAEGNVLFYIVGGHFVTEYSKPELKQLAKELEVSVEELETLHKKTPVLDAEKFKAVVRKLSEISCIYQDEVRKEEQDTKISRVVHFISELSEQIAGEINLKDLLLSIVKKVTETFEVDRCATVLLDEKRQYIDVYASNQEYAEEIFGGKVEPGEGATGIVTSTGEVFYAYDAQNDERLDTEQIRGWNLKSLLSLPLKVGGQVIGLLHLVSEKQRRLFTEREIQYAEALASEISLIVEIARLYNESQKRAEIVQKSRDEIKSYFTKIGTALSTSLDLKQLLQLIVELSVHLTHSDAGSIYLIDNKNLSKYVAVTYEKEGEREKVFKTLDKTWKTYTTVDFLEEQFAPEQVKSYLGIPLERQGETKGLLNIISRDAKEYSPEDIELLTIFAGHAAMAIDNARLFVLEQKKAREATTLYNAVKTIGERMNLDEVLNGSVEQLTEVIGVNRCLLLLMDYKKLELYMAAQTGLSDEQNDFFSVYRIPIDEIADEIWESFIQGRSVKLSSSPTDCPAFEKFFTVLPTNSCLMAPLLSKEQLIGLIYLDDTRLAHTFTETQVRLVMTLTIQIASAIQRAILVDQLERNLDQLKALHQVSTAVTGTLSLSKVFELVVEKASQLIDAPAASMLSIDDEGREYYLQAHFSLTPELEDEKFQKAISEKAFKRKRYMTYYVSTDFEREEPLVYDTLKNASMGGYISVPLIARKRVVGILNCFCKEGDKFDTQEIRLLSSFANQASTAVENARLYSIIQNKVRELATVFEVGKSITSTLELEKVIDEISSSMLQVMNADASSIMLLDEKHQELEVIHTFGLGKFHQGDHIKVGEGIAGIAAKTGRPMVLHDEEGQSSTYKFPDNVRQDGLKTILSVPLKIRDKVIGLINIYKKSLFHFAPTEINLVTTLANQAAVAIENARLYKEQYKIAQIIRRNLMPSTEMFFDNIDVGHVYIPSEILSGDYFEIIKLGSSRYGLVISDVSGKGTEAAIYNARAKYILRSYAMADYSPKDILSLLNNLMFEETAEDKFISLLYVDLDIEAKEMIISSAGHEPLIFWDNSEKEAKLIDDSNLLIGVFLNVNYTQELVDVENGDILVLYTDGITEARSRQGEFFGVQRLKDIVKENFHLSAQALANKIYTVVQKFTRRQISDDFSLLVIKL